MNDYSIITVCCSGGSIHVLTLLDIITVNKALLWELNATNRTVAWNKINRVWMTCVLSRIKVQCNHKNNLIHI